MWGNKQQPKILIIEDEKHNHPVFQAAFEAAGFAVKIEPSAEGDFVAKVAELKPDIISMDLMIGHEHVFVPRDGFKAIELLKNDDRTKEIPIMVASNFFQEDKVKYAKTLGAVDYFNLQGQPIGKIAERYKAYIDKPRKYNPSHPLFQED